MYNNAGIVSGPPPSPDLFETNGMTKAARPHAIRETSGPEYHLEWLNDI